MNKIALVTSVWSMTVLYSRWSFAVNEDASTLVLPDGCRDLIVVRQNGKADRWFFSDWDFCPRQVCVAAGQQFFGYRLRPGLVLEHQALQSIEHETTDLHGAIPGLLKPDWDLLGAIDALSSGRYSVRQVALQTGVTERTFQRYFKRAALPTPEYWRLLGRARRAAARLNSSSSITDLAAEFEYSDQAHMTRDFKRWFGKTPNQLKQSPEVLAMLSHAGLGNWTGEHISTR
ncbi:helix-turn-helix domain-containing protein [Bowmanella denitrificans]|uniref:helix-turn-helix domain-containing protein n=1 Tax=Bowmanella denitrificans TaxID=366582 RepID=UPI0011AF9FA5|nr:AraC family transcriptional regulator [Bowmanella denitrificans]